MRRYRWLASLALGLPLALLTLGWAARAPTGPVRADLDQALAVTSNADSGPGSLRQAISDAASGGTIRFAVTGDIALLRPLVIDKRLTIDGPGAESLAIRGGERVRLFRVVRGAELTLRSLTLADGMGSDEPWNTPTPTPTVPPTLSTAPPARFPIATPKALAAARGAAGGGLPERSDDDRPDQPGTPTPTPTALFSPYAGGAIHNLGMLTIEDCFFENNTSPGRGTGPGTSLGGGAIYNERGAVTIRRSTFLGNRDEGGDGGGGAILNLGGPMTIVDSSFQSNVAEGLGHAVLHLRSRMVIVGSTFLHNKARLSSGSRVVQILAVIFSDTVSEGELILANSTVAHNDSDIVSQPFALISSGLTTIVNSTFLDSRIFNSPGPRTDRERFTMRNSLLVNAGGANCINDAPIDGGHNLQFPDMSCGPSIPVADPLLDVWSPGSGPALTISLAPGSPAIDAGDPAACAEWPVLGVDARGRLRGGDGNGDGTGGCDIGAFEVGAAITATPSRTPTEGPSPTPTMSPTPSITPKPSITPTRTRTPTPTSGPPPTTRRPPATAPPPPSTCTPPPCDCGRLVGTCPSRRCLPCTATPVIPPGRAFLPVAWSVGGQGPAPDSQSDCPPIP